MHTPYIASALATLLTLTSATDKVRTVYQFASNDTWLENLVTRANGIVLATEIGPPASLLAFDPRQPNATKQTIFTFDTVLGLSGITETSPDVFVITGSNTTSSNIQDPPKNATEVWRVDFTANTTHPDISLICRPTQPTDFNGLAAYNETLVLASATFQSSIYAVDIETGASWEAIKKNDSMSQINGIKVQDGYVYWTANALYRAPLYPNITAGAVQTIYSPLTADDFAIAPDGFALNSTYGAEYGFAYIATAGENSVVQIVFDGDGHAVGSEETIAGAEDSTEMAEPTGCFFGRGEGEERKVFVTTGGGSGVAVDVDGTDVAVGAQLLEISLPFE
ncbi:hypothetical protein Tdes44962_MAKER01314 [Teratosphaeria destructans]|uniref:Uncharacterized protein n=1 Tax=Teratosphaeria destructans TaxID=418781 RepID=A0A9W7T1J7_9PEZI|nr:hypothetical protein Tdes44962_MAKER01314 [Teratosphaeria destructans]